LTSTDVLNLSGGSLAIAADSSINNALNVTTGASLVLSSLNLSGTGTLTNNATVTLSFSNINDPLVNQGTLLAQGNSAINGAFTTTASSDVRVQGIAGDGGSTNLTFLNGFTNNGTVELTNAYSQQHNATLTVTNGTLINAVGANFNVLPGSVGGASRTLAAQLDNRGTLTVAPR